MESVRKYSTNDAILKEIKNIYGIEKCEENINNYIEYVNLRKKENINIANFNILIRCRNEYAKIEKLIQAIIKLLQINNIASTYIYLKEKELKKSHKGNNKEIIIVDSDFIDISNNLIKGELEKYIQDNQNKIFIIADKTQKSKYNEDFKSKNIFWVFELEEASAKDKIRYINEVLQQNHIRINRNCSIFNVMPNNSYDKIQNDLLNLVVKCKSKNIKKITDKVLLENLKEKVYLKEISRRKSGVKELNNLEGLAEVKQQVYSIINYIKINKNRGNLPSLHMSFEGNPGCGKTSVARIIGKIFAEEKILSDKEKFVEIHARDLVAQYVGWTAKQTKEIVEQAEGGVLFIDETYSLISDRTSFEKEAIDSLIKLMEDKRDKICIILAGYTEEMQKLFDMNPGFRSRINFHIQFPDYTEEELYTIFKKMVKKENYKLSNNIKDIILEYFIKEKQREDFANGRSVRNLFERIKFEQANRVALDNTQDINLIKKCDIQNVIYELSRKQKQEKRRIGF